jgi:hypothetical protein
MHQGREEDALRSMSHTQLGSALPRISTGKAATSGLAGFLNLTTLPGETQRQYIVNCTPAYSREIQRETNSYNAFTS